MAIKGSFPITMSKQHLAQPTDSPLSHQAVENSQGPDWSDQKYRRLFEAINTGFALCQTIKNQTGKMIDCRFLELNPAFEKLTGVPPQEAVGKTARDVFPALDPAWFDTYQQLIDSGQTIRFERFMPGLDRWFEMTAFFYGNDQFVVHYDDITARRQAQESQQQSKVSLQLALDIAQLGTWSWNLLTNEGYLDARGAELIGLAPGHLANVAQAQMSSIHPDDLAHTEAEVMAGIARGLPFGLSYRVIHPDQSVRHIRSRFHVVTDPKGSPVELMGTNLDMTAEYELTTALRQNQEKQAFLLALSDALQALADPIEIQTTSVRLLEQYLGNTQIQFIPMTGQEVIIHAVHGSHQPLRMDTFRSMTLGVKSLDSDRGGQVQVVADVAMDPVHTLAERAELQAAQIGAYITVPLVKKQQWVATLTILSIQARSWTLSEVELIQETAERTWTVLERSRTETALGQSEEQLRQLLANLESQVQQRTEELAAANHELAINNQALAEANGLLVRSNANLQTFAFIASHDLQEPLRKIQQFGDLLKTYLTDPAGEALMYLERMQISASRMSTLIRDLLNYSRISTLRDQSAPVSLQTIVATVLNTLDWTIQQTEAQIQVGPLPMLPGDAAQLGQLFQNLLSNALKFVKPGVDPRIQILSSWVLASDLPKGFTPHRPVSGYYRIDVVDNGIGFEEKYLDRIFQVFQRLHGKSKFAGTGIGLAICEKVVTNHGGAITASSQSGQGATFSVFLPGYE
ncbi:ATP-binding protein [Larkinella humicola]|uniref:histidine kinase n=1 Tax=Larkinella humicola TaxID=2607654 RepID=A0A5N1JNR4_9BACT|nr:ATP-binding protein [Larkinella humicola]KAA9357256.1 PAS domain-containing protein [Larkinella humicola]